MGTKAVKQHNDYRSFVCQNHDKEKHSNKHILVSLRTGQIRPPMELPFLNEMQDGKWNRYNDNS